MTSRDVKGENGLGECWGDSAGDAFLAAGQHYKDVKMVRLPTHGCDGNGVLDGDLPRHYNGPIRN